MNAVAVPALLALGELDRADRDWILAHLEDAERQRLERALTQADGAIDLAAGRPAAPLTARERVVNAQAWEMHRLLSTEPDWMVAALCGLHRWPWLAELLRLMGHGRAERIMALARGRAELAPGVVETLIDLLGAQLERAVSPASQGLHRHYDDTTADDRVRRRWLGRLSAWLR